MGVRSWATRCEEMKTPGIQEALKPLHRLEVRACEAFEKAHAAYGREHEVWRLRKDAAEQKAKADLKKNSSANVALYVPEPKQPIERRYVTNDTSYERLEAIARNPNGVLAYQRRTCVAV